MQSRIHIQYDTFFSRMNISLIYYDRLLRDAKTFLC